MNVVDQRSASPSRGVFITFEGGEGCGKSTQVERLDAWLQQRGLKAVTLREPGGTAIGEHIRHLLQFTPEARNMTPETELLLFAASRAQLVREIAAPLLETGAIVVCDRFHDSTTVYQGAGRRIDPDAVANINTFAIGSTRPDITFLLDLPVDVARSRLLRRLRPVGAPDRMESLPSDFYQAVRRAYLGLAAAEPSRFVVLDATQSAEDVFHSVLGALGSRFPGRFS